ncbi:MAG: hypothetical protein ACJA1C_000551 [Crocinitomicaceae bacterium]|jgi:hypothetical protein
MIFRLFPILLVVVFCTSCTAYIRVAIDEKPKASSPEGFQRVGVFNRTRQDPNQMGVTNKTIVENNNVAVDKSIDGAFNSMVRNNIWVKEYDMDSIGMIVGFDWAILDSLGRIDSLDFFIELGSIESKTTGTGSIGSVITGQSRQARQKLNGLMYVSFYELDSHFVQELLIVKHDEEYPISLSPLEAKNNARSKKAGFERMGYQLGFKASELVFPHVITENRQYYKYGSKSINEARKFIMRRQWVEAEAILVLTMDDGKPGRRGKELFNMAMVQEAQGNLDQAIQFAERSAYNCKNTNAKIYLRKLQESAGISPDEE